jgi:aspartyl protease family protein
MIITMKNLTFVFFLCFSILLTNCSRKRQARETNTVSSRTDRTQRTRYESPVTHGETSVKMRKADGVYYVPCKINGTEMEFIFDTGASDITMSLTEAIFLYKQGKLSDDDFIGRQQYQIADGSIHEGTVVILRKVQIGNWELSNIQASIVDNMEAPLLLGQSALAKFGKISIDYKKNEIIFE